MIWGAFAIFGIAVFSGVLAVALVAALLHFGWL